MLIEEPNLNCANCWQLYADNRGAVLPLCKRPIGCHIEDLATDPDVNDFIDRYRMARALYDVNEIPEFLEKELTKLGLDDDPGFLLSLEIIYSEAKAINRAKAQNEIQRKRWSR